MRQRTEYQHFTGQMTIDPRSEGISDKALAFLWTEVLHNPSYPSEDARGLGVSDLLPMKSWSADTLEDFDRLADNVKAEVLRLYTLLNHELTHHIDFLTTPFGAAFHSFACYERLLMLEMTPDLLGNDSIDLARPLVDQGIMVLDFSSRTTITDLWGPLYSILDADRRANCSSFREGWGPDLPSSVQWFGKNYQAVTVRDDLLTILMPETKDVYLNVKTIIEGRAVANCLRYIITLTGSNLDRSRDALLLYLNDQYPPNTKTTWADYRFLFDLLAGVYGMDTIEQVIAQQGSVHSLQQIPCILSSATWFALHGPDPIQRLLLAFEVIHNHIAAGETSSDPLAFVEAVEARIVALSRKTNVTYIQVEDILKKHIELLEYIRHRNENETEHPDIKQHFEYIFTILLGNLRSRLGLGYRSLLGLPTDGNPLWGIDQNNEGLLPGYKCSPAVHGWFALRNKLVHEQRSAVDKRVKLRQQFGLL